MNQIQKLNKITLLVETKIAFLVLVPQTQSVEAPEPFSLTEYPNAMTYLCRIKFYKIDG